MILIGNLANDPEGRTTQSGISQSSFRLAVQRRYANQQGVREADFINIVAWRNTADFCNRYLTKGRKIAVEGSIQTRSYDAQDGSKRYVTEIIADSVEALGSRESGGQAQPAKDAQPAQGAQDTPPAPNDFTEVDDDELPF